MAKPVLVLPLLMALFLLPMHASAGAASAGAVSMATHELFPYGYYDPAGNFSGYAVERIRFAAARCGWELRLQVVPWARAQALAKSDSVDGFFAGSLNEERNALFVASDVLAPQNWTWYLLQDAPMNPEAPDFKRMARVGSFIGANMLAYLEQNGFNVTARPKDTEALFRMLLEKRFDAILVNDLVAAKVIEKHGIAAKVRPHLLKSEPLHALFTKRFVRENPNFLECFNAALAEFEARQARDK